MIKQAKAVTWLAGMVFALTGIFAGEALAGISATKHNLSTTGASNTYGTPAVAQAIYSSDQTEICIFCHTPHASIKNDNIPLWNHQLSSVATYGVYTSPSLDASPGELGGLIGGKEPAGATASNLCLSCHDGTVAINSFANPSNNTPTTTMVGTTGGLMPAGNTNLGSDLRDDHPVNFLFNATLASTDGTLNTPSDLAGTGLGGAKLFNGFVQCASCHDPHTSAQSTFLRVSMNQSQLCTGCHNK